MAQHDEEDLVELLDQMTDSERKRSNRESMPLSVATDMATGFSAQKQSNKRAQSSVAEKRKLKIEIQIGSAHVAVTEPQDLFVRWTRHGKTISTKKQTVDTTIIEPKFKDRFSMTSGFKYDVATQTFLPDISQIELFCENKQVGVCTIDLVQYIDVKPKVEKVVIASDLATRNALEHKVLLGDQNLYPGAFITFKILVESTFQPYTPSSNMRGSQLSRRSTQSKQFNQGFADSERLEKMNLAIDQLKLKYQPIISQNAEKLELCKKEHQDLLARKQKLEERVALVDKNSGPYIIYQTDRCRNRLGDLRVALQAKREYHKRLQTKLKAYQEVSAVIQAVGGNENEIQHLLEEQEQATQKIEKDLQENESARVQASMYAFDEDSY